MKIQILGTGCPKCNQLYQNVNDAVAATGVEADVEKVSNLADIMAFGVDGHAGTGNRRTSQGQRKGAGG